MMKDQYTNGKTGNQIGFNFRIGGRWKWIEWKE